LPVFVRNTESGLLHLFRPQYFPYRCVTAHYSLHPCSPGREVERVGPSGAVAARLGLSSRLRETPFRRDLYLSKREILHIRVWAKRQETGLEKMRPASTSALSSSRGSSLSRSGTHASLPGENTGMDGPKALLSVNWRFLKVFRTSMYIYYFPFCFPSPPFGVKEQGCGGLGCSVQGVGCRV